MTDVQTQCPDERCLLALLRETLGVREHLDVESHLGSCPNCQQRLETLAAGDVMWSGCLRSSPDDHLDAGSAFWSALSRLGDALTPACAFVSAPLPPAPEPSHAKTELQADQASVLESDYIKSIQGDLSQATSESALAAQGRPGILGPGPAVGNSASVQGLSPGSRLGPGLEFLAPSDRPESAGRLGSFEILEEIGRGGMGVVLHAYDPSLQRDVAIKLLLPRLAEDDRSRKRFCREARAIAAVAHEFVLGVYSVDEEPAANLPYLVMPLVRGESLEQRLKRDGPLPVSEIARIGMQVAAGLSAAHAASLIHRDVKPSNILLEGDAGRVKISDFGLARSMDDVRMTRTGYVVGTPLYMSPEQARGEDMDARSDLFSLGVMLYEACTGVTPFAGNTPLAVLRRLSDEPHRPIRELNPDAPDWLAAIINQLLEKEPEDRFQSAAEVAELFAAKWSELEPVSALQVPQIAHPLAFSPSKNKPKPKLRKYATLVADGSGLMISLGILGLVICVVIGIMVFARMNGNSLSASGSVSEYEIMVLNANTGPIWNVAYHPDGTMLAMALDDGTVKLWELPSGRLRTTFSAHKALVLSAAFHPREPRLATASDDGTVKLWDLETPEMEPMRTFPHGISVRTLAFAPDGRWFVTGSRDGRVRVWETATGRETVKTIGHTGNVMSVDVSRDGAFFVSSGSDKTIRQWDSATGRLINEFTGHPGGVYSAVISPDNRWIASAGWGKTVRLWNISGALQAEWSAHDQDIWALAFSPDSRSLVSAGEDNTAKLWDVASRRLRAHFHGPQGTLYTVRFAPNVPQFTAAGRDGAARIWDVSRLPALAP